jgi:hypothetical protein
MPSQWLPFASTATPVRSRSATACSAFIHTGKLPGTAMTAAMPSTLTTEAIRSPNLGGVLRTLPGDDLCARRC